MNLAEGDDLDVKLGWQKMGDNRGWEWEWNGREDKERSDRRGKVTSLLSQQMQQY